MTIGRRNINPDQRVDDAGVIRGQDPVDNNTANPFRASENGRVAVELPYNNSQVGEVITAEEQL
jgi:hypothetical protein